MPSDDSILAAMNADLSKRREHELRGFIKPPSTLQDATKRILAVDTASDAEARQRAAQSVESERLREREKHLSGYLRQRGRRYAACSLDNFVVSGAGEKDRRAAVDALRGYLAAWEKNYAAGYGVALFGPCGTGKDHLAAAVCHHAINAGQRVEWVDGMTLFAELRRSFDRDSRENETRIIDRYERAPVLCISDPLPVSGELTDFQAGALLRIIDGRYNDLRPTIITLNVVGRDEAQRRLTPPIYDRVRHTSLAIPCNWPSYRQPPR